MTDLDESEQRHVRTALRYLRLCVGQWEPLAKALHHATDTIEKVINERRAVTPRLAFRVARFAGVAIEDVIDGTYPGVGTCPHCGHPREKIDENEKVLS